MEYRLKNDSKSYMEEEDEQTIGESLRYLFENNDISHVSISVVEMTDF